MRVYLFVVCLLLAQLMPGASKTAGQLEKEAQTAEKAGDITRAYLLYAEAAAKDPLNTRLWARMQILRPAVGNLHAASEPEKPAEPPSLDPSIAGTITDLEIAESRILLPPPELRGKPGLQDFDYRGDSRQIVERLARAFGLEAVFDSAYQPKTGLHLQLSQADYRDALWAVEAATESFLIPFSSTQFLVANDTQQKRTELDKTASIVVPVPEPFAIQEIQEIATGIRGTLDIQKLAVDSQRRLILIKDRATKVRMAQKLVMDLMRPRAQVAVEVELLAADRTSSMVYGLSLPTSFAVTWLGTASGLTTSLPSGFMNYLGFGGGKSFIGLGITNAGLFANISKSSSQTLISSEIVTSDGQASTLHVGDKYPIVTAGYFGTTTGTGQVYAPPPTFNFEDLGLILKITPRVHDLDEITLEVEAEFKLLGNQAVDGIPVISARKFQSKVRVRNGEWAVLAGLMTDSDGRSITGIAGLSAIPFLRKNSLNKSHGETLIVLKPHLLSLPASEAVMQPAWFGTETKPRTPL